MKLFHYTTISRLAQIMEEGLNKGEVPTSSHTWFNAVNLTTDPSPVGHGLSDARFLTENEARFLGYKVYSKQPVHYFGNKRKVRLTADVRRQQLRRWIRWAQKNIDPGYMETLIRTGGGMAKARTWYFSEEPIPPSSFRLVEVYDDGRRMHLEEYSGHREEEFSDRAVELGFSEWGNQIFLGHSEGLTEQIEKTWERVANASVSDWSPEQETGHETVTSV